MPGILGFIAALTQMVSPRQIPLGEGGTSYVNPMWDDEEAPEEEDESRGFDITNMTDEEEAPEEEDESQGFDITTMSDEDRAYYYNPYYGWQRRALLENLGCTSRKRLSSEETLDAFEEMIDWMRTNLKNHNTNNDNDNSEVATWTEDNIMGTHKFTFGFINGVFNGFINDDDDDDDVFE